ncbi:MAG TPA: crotonase/enoyl-CoA hydratase family protein [Caulobacteraceae bacterium]|nr:crotonase/enoyl-CoA hydratase family protein [Caulobacteraceae bacterium]
MEFRSIAYEVKGRRALITLNRPERMNAIDRHMPREIADAVAMANEDNAVHVIVLTGAGKGFCGGYDLVEFAERRPAPRPEGDGGPAAQDNAEPLPWDPMADFYMMNQNTRDFMSLWRSFKPTIARVHGPAVAGGSDIALCCDMVLMADEARIGYPPARVWGCPTTAMWVYRLGAEKAKRMLFTGDLVGGQEALKLGLCLDSVPLADLDARVDAICARIEGVPRNQLMMQKLMINQAFENMGLTSTQTLATFFDGVTRNSPEGVWFKQQAEAHGFKAAVAMRDGGDPIAEGWSRPFRSTFGPYRP